MDRGYHFFYLGLIFWLLAILAWFAYVPLGTLALAVLALGSFVFHRYQPQVFTMFGKNKNTMDESPAHVVAPTTAAEKARPVEEKQNNTVIAHGIFLKGNLSGNGQIYIYGEVEGNVEACEGLVKVMRNGQVKGNIQARELIIDGSVVGECRAETIDIDEHGNVNGALAYATLGVKKGGVFTGQVELLAVEKKQTNVIGFNAENAASTPVNEKATAALNEIKPAITQSKKRG